MVIDAAARRPGLTLAVCAWVAFAAPAAVAVQRAATIDGSLDRRVVFASGGFAEFPSLCLVVAALLLLVEHVSSPFDRSPARMLAPIVLLSAVVAVVASAAGVIVQAGWSTSAPAWAWFAAILPSISAGALAAVAALLAERSMRVPNLPEDYG